MESKRLVYYNEILTFDVCTGSLFETGNHKLKVTTSLTEKCFECQDTFLGLPAGNTLSATASVPQLTDHRTRITKSQVLFPAGKPEDAFFATGPGRVLK